MLRGLLALGLFCLVGSCANVPGYKIVSGSEKATSWGMQAELSLLPNSGSPYGMDFQNLQLNVTHISSNIVRVQIYPSNDEQRWRVPENILKGPAANKTTTDTANLQYSVTLQQNPFSLAITRKSDGEVFFNSSQATDEFNGLIFSEQYIEWSTQLDTTPYIYGLGERVDSFLLNASQNSKPYGMFNRDQGAARRQLNLYGTHPMYLRMNSNNSRAHGSFMLNTNAMDVTLRPNFLTWKLIGGIIDLFFFIPSEMSEPEQVVELYTSIIGRSFLPSYYILGRHQCRWGYNTIEETQQVVERYAMHDIPLDSMWNDIDYMDNYLDFTTDPVRFPIAAMKEFTNYLHERGQHYLIIVDPGIAVQSGYPPYEQGLAGNIFLMDWTKSQAIEGKVWPGVTVFPDFSAENTSTWWETAIQQFYDSGVYFDGLWADMSEPASFCSGTCPTTPISTPPNDVLDDPPYLPVNAPLNTSTVSMSAQGALGYQYNAHNLYGYAETKTTYNALKKLLNTRPFVMPRSTFASSGYYGAHWLGDNFSTWEYLRNSIAGVLSFQLFGIPIVGADICGFNLETTDELCTRWEQLGAFYPFSRNHNHRAMRAQEPYALSEQHLLITKNAIRLRYSLLPYFYFLAFNAHRNGSVIWRPLFFSFPSDSNCYSIEEQFMVGKAMLVSPVLSQGETTVDAYFPAGIWFDFYSGAMVSNNQNNGTWITLDAPIDTINVHLLGGSIVVMQAGGLTTTESRNNPMELLIQLSAANRASGFLIIDDGKSLDTVENLLYTEIQFMVQYDESVSNYTLSSNVLMEGYDSGMFLGSIRVSGVTRAPTSVTVNGTSITTFTYSALSNVLKVSGLLLPITSLHSIVF